MSEGVYFAKDRCKQENLIEQLKNGVRAMRLPVNTLESNWAYMVIGALAWSFKIWLALLQPALSGKIALSSSLKRPQKARQADEGNHAIWHLGVAEGRHLE